MQLAVFCYTPTIEANSPQVTSLKPAFAPKRAWTYKETPSSLISKTSTWGCVLESGPLR
jgi:hypothetical protein